MLAASDKNTLADGQLHKTVVIDVVALTRDLIRPETTPFIHSFLSRNKSLHSATRNIEPIFPALTCSSQTTYITGAPPSEHGIIGNGFYDKEYCEIRNWHQSAKLVRVPRIFESLKKEYPSASTFSNCWWFPMYDDYLDYAITPRPQYLANGGKLPDCYTKPAHLRDTLQGALGKFPLHRFWGPTTSIESSEWIAKASIMVDEQYNPDLSLIYLPHLDYCLQKYGPNDTEYVPADLQQVDNVVKMLVEYYESVDPNVRIIILSEYGIEPVQKPIHINRILRNMNMVAVRQENYGETLDCGASIAFALSDHQVAHVYVNDTQAIDDIKTVLLDVEGIDHVLEAHELNEYFNRLGFDRNSLAHHPSRSGDLTVIASEGYWFTYYYFDPVNAPDFAHTINIHRKPGYDPAEMLFKFKNPVFGKLWLFFKLFLVYILKLRLTVDGTSVERADEIRGSHGRVDVIEKYKPVIGTNATEFLGSKGRNVEPEQVYDIIWNHLTK
ncbi:alkaline-phosphatase-like protein [Paraphysoderma sedebokerense]|nr:alkaline-phosphatase-like protein [Paraphysoderma sedebokerense]